MRDTPHQGAGSADPCCVPALVWAFRFGHDGVAKALDVDEPIGDGDGWTWLHLNLSDARAAAWLAQSDLPDIAKGIFRQHATHQQLYTSDGCIAGVVSDLARTFEGTDDTVTHLYFVMTERMLVSGRHRPLTGAAKTREVLESGRVRLGKVASLFELIVEKLADGVDHYIDDLAARLDGVEERLSRGDRPERHGELGRVRRTSVRIHRELAGLRMALWRLERDDLEELPPALQITSGKLVQRLDAIDRAVVDLRDRARLLQEEINALVAEESNRALNTLSVITAIFLPPTFITGVFGMNIKGLPFAEDPNGFLYAVALMAMSVAAVLIVMRRVGVLRR